jgi:hypothetical protein
MLASLRRFFARLAFVTRQLICGLHGHDALLHYGHERLSLLCWSCGYETPGWDLKGVPARRVEANGQRRRLVRVPLVRQRAA